MRARRMLAAALIAAAWVAPGLAQQSDVTGQTVITSEPGRAKAVRTEAVTARVVAIDKATRTFTLKGPHGNTIDVVAGDEVRNFDQVRVGDAVVARYVRAIALELRKSKAESGDVAVREQAMRAAPGERPAIGAQREIRAIAEVVALDAKKNTITLKGPHGDKVVLDVLNPDQFKVLKKGDQIDVVYAESVALSVEPMAEGSSGQKTK